MTPTDDTTRVLSDPTSWCAQCGCGGYPQAVVATHRDTGCYFRARPLTREDAAEEALYAATDRLGGYLDLDGHQALADALDRRLRTQRAVRDAQVSAGGGQDAGRGGGGAAYPGQRDGSGH